MSALEYARSFLDRLSELGKDWRERLQELPEDVQEAFWKVRKASFYKEEHRRPECRKEVLSPEGRYKLVIDTFTTGTGSWNYTQGTIYHQDSDKPVAVVQRNYCSFPYLWVEHPNGHLYLVCGENYQGQTVIEVDTGERRDTLPGEAKQGWGFCWAVYKFDPATCLLLVDGCFWACPYEFKFFDFSDPMKGWPELETDHEVYADSRWPEVGPDGAIRCFQSQEAEESDEDAEDEDSENKVLPPVAAILTFKREGLKLVLQDEWVSDKEKATREDRKEANRKYEEWLANYKTSDPLYLEFARLVADPAFDPDKRFWIGFTHEKWCPHWQGDERRIGRSVIQQKKDRTLHADIEWGVGEGPIKLIVVSKDNRDEFFFEHSVEGMQAAFAKLRTLL